MRSRITADKHRERKAQGLCLYCGSNAIPNQTLCTRCTVRRRSRYHDRASKGLCVTPGCGNPTLNDRLCVDHRRQVVEGRRRYKAEALAAYGGPSCVGCGETDDCVLSLDHVDQQGGVHRKTVSAAKNLYSHLRRLKYPVGYRVLCLNCQRRAYVGAPFPKQLVPRISGQAIERAACDSSYLARAPFDSGQNAVQSPLYVPSDSKRTSSLQAGRRLADYWSA